VNTMNHKQTCEGACHETHGGHDGRVRKVIVSGQGQRAVEFNYCENAIAEDRSRGFQVDEVAECPLADMLKSIVGLSDSNVRKQTNVHPRKP